MRPPRGYGFSAATADSMRKILALVTIVAVAGALGVALTGTNVVPATHAGLSTRATGSNDVKPSSCSGITVTATVSSAGAITGTVANELILGSGGVDTISGLLGNDCIVGGAGNDVIDGGLGTDVCLGGPGTDTFVSCETQVQ
jgi:Ca2+-binding RTX toxin-like protein